MKWPLRIAVWSLGLLLSTGPCFAHGGVHVTDGTGARAGEFENAVNAMADGDLLVVRGDGFFALDGPTIDGRSAFIAVDPTATVDFNVVSLTIQNLGPDQVVALVGLKGTILELELKNNQGTVWIEGVEAQHGVVAENCDNLVLVRTELKPSDPSLGFGQTALILTDTRASLYGCELTGGHGIFVGGDGGHGVDHLRGELFLSDSTVTGGSGTNNHRNGDAVRIAGNGAQLHVLDSALTPGRGGVSGLSINAFANTRVVEFPGQARSISLPGPTAYGQPFTTKFRGQPGDGLLVIRNLDPDGALWKQRRGVLLVDPVAPLLTPLGSTASGELDVTLNAPTLPNLDFFCLFYQTSFNPVGDKPILSAPSVGIFYREP